MEDSKLLLIKHISALEMIKAMLESEIRDLKAQLGSTESGEGIHERTLPEDPDILGFDSLGRLKRKRTISPELREKKRKLIAVAREKRLAGLQKLSGKRFIIATDPPSLEVSKLLRKPRANPTTTAKAPRDREHRNE
jgi:hypothetical protein